MKTLVPIWYHKFIVIAYVMVFVIVVIDEVASLK
jgi:hypothetical protein